MWKRRGNCRRQWRWETIINWGHLDQTWLAHVWAHRDCGNAHRVCTGQRQMGVQAPEKEMDKIFHLRQSHYLNLITTHEVYAETKTFTFSTPPTKCIYSKFKNPMLHSVLMLQRSSVSSETQGSLLRKWSVIYFQHAVVHIAHYHCEREEKVQRGNAVQMQGRTELGKLPSL